MWDSLIRVNVLPLMCWNLNPLYPLSVSVSLKIVISFHVHVGNSLLLCNILQQPSIQRYYIQQRWAKYIHTQRGAITNSSVEMGNKSLQSWQIRTSESQRNIKYSSTLNAFCSICLAAGLSRTEIFSRRRQHYRSYWSGVMQKNRFNY